MPDDMLERLKTALADRYTIERELGRGGMATVYLAEDVKHRRKVAIKVLRPELAASIGVDRFLREIEIAANLTHPHILPLHDSGEADGFLYYVMPYIDGESLRDRLLRERQLPIDDALALTREVASALSYAHDQGVVHRDIKPENIMLSAGGAVVADFGIARAVTAAGGEQLTETGMAVGTPAYMSPEQASGEPGIDARSDIYSLGCVLYEMLAGEAPYSAPTPQALIAKKLAEPTPRISVVRELVPSGIEVALVRALAKTPADRYVTATQFLDALTRREDLLETEKERAGAAFGIRRLVKPTLAALAATIVVIVAITRLLPGGLGEEAIWARTEALPEIRRLVAEENYAEAYAIAKRVAQTLDDDSLLAEMWPLVTMTGNVRTAPPGALAYLAPWPDSTSEWELLGETPLDSTRFPLGYWRLKFELEGYRTVQVAGSSYWLLLPYPADYVYRLDRDNQIPHGMVRVPPKPWYTFMVDSGRFRIQMAGLETVEPVALADYFMGAYEVTNREYKDFIDAGGYRNRDLWEHPFIRDDTELPWQAAVSEFVDQTGRPGPSTWVGGTYPTGQEDYPVGGVGWYEAAAYARFAGASLPTVLHWVNAAAAHFAAQIVPHSNFGGSNTAAVGQASTINPWGLYDIAGNVREWCFNPRGGDRFMLGGGVTDPAWRFAFPYSASPFDRSPTNGIRLAQYPDGTQDLDRARENIPPLQRDLRAEQSIDDAGFSLIRAMYAYDKGPLNAELEQVDDSSDARWVRQQVSFDAAYGGERVLAQILLPRNVEPPYQTVVFFPGGAAVMLESSSDEVNSRNNVQYSFIVSSGRALIYPVYKSTFERQDGFGVADGYPNETNNYRDHMIMWSKDLGRTIDYIETRADLDAEKIAYYGSSWGGALGGILPAVEPRISTVIIYVGGFWMQQTQPAASGINFAPRITVPVLMLNGRYDFNFPYETSQLPLYERLGTPEEHKNLVVSPGGHGFPLADLARQILDWLDRYFGPVR
ncbi:protein kinase [Gemmatimonadota bacterium]